MELNTSNELRQHFAKGVEAVFIFRLLHVATFFFTEAHRTSKDGLEGFRSSESASLTVGWTPSKQIHQKPKSFWRHCRQTMPKYRPMAWPCSSKLHEQEFNLCNLSFFTIEEGLDRWNNQSRRAHRDLFPLSDHLFTLMTVVQVDLTEQQREILTSHLTVQGIPLRSCTFDFIISAVLEHSVLRDPP